MWHEARRVEKQIRGMMVDYRKRAERRRAFYDRMKQDSTQLIRIYGHSYKIHLEKQVATAAEAKSVMMPWQGNADNMIDRFDGRAHLDLIPEHDSSNSMGPLLETNPEEQQLNYERYRTLVMVEHSGVSEEAYLQQLALEEMYPKKDDEAKERKQKSAAKASIGYSYDSVAPPVDNEEDAESDEDSDISDLDVTLDVDELTKKQEEELDTCAIKYGMGPVQYCRKLKADKVEAEENRRMKAEEEERAMMGGRRSRKDRRSAREKLLQARIQDSPPSYARRASPTYEEYRKSRSRSSSRSCSPEDTAGQVEFITEFAGPSASADPHSHCESSRSKTRDRERRRSRSRERHRRSRDRSRNRSRGRSHDRSRDRSRERSRDRSRERSRDRSRERSRDRSRERSRDRSRERSRGSSRRSRSRSPEHRSYRDRYHGDRHSKESDRAKDTAKASAKLSSLSKQRTAKKTTDTKDKNTLTPQERMKKRMQLMLNKQLKSDRKDERKKKDVKEQERLEREDDLRHMQRKWRDRDRDYDYSRSPSPRRGRYRSPSPSPRGRRSSRSPSPASGQTASVVDMEEHTQGEKVIHYVYK